MSPTVQDPEEVRTYFVRLADDSKPIRIRAETLCRERRRLEGGKMVYVFKRDGQKIGEIDGSHIVGWWIDETAETA